MELCISAAAVRDGAVSELYTEGPVTGSSLFQVASISKFVFTAAFLRLTHEADISLDTDVVPLLKGFSLKTQSGAAARATIRELLSHTAGVSPSGFGGYDEPSPLPSTLEILNGTGPCSTKRFVQISEPGLHWSYTGGGFMMLQLFAEQFTGLSMEQFMRRYILDPLSMHSSTFLQASDAVPVDGIPFYDPPLPHGHRFFPEGAAAGLITTPSDIALFGAALQASLSGNGILPQHLAEEMVTPQCSDVFTMESTRDCMTGLGCYLKDINGRRYFGHQGDNPGYLSVADFSLDGEKGVCACINSDSPEAEKHMYEIQEMLLG